MVLCFGNVVQNFCSCPWYQEEQNSLTIVDHGEFARKSVMKKNDTTWQLLSPADLVMKHKLGKSDMYRSQKSRHPL